MDVWILFEGTADGPAVDSIYATEALAMKALHEAGDLHWIEKWPVSLWTDLDVQAGPIIG